MLRGAYSFACGCLTAYGADHATGGWRGLSFGQAWLLTVLIIAAVTILGFELLRPRRLR